MSALFRQDELSSVAARHASAMKIGAPARRRLWSLVAFCLLLLALGMVEAEFSVSRIVSGLSRLGDFALLMIPPEPGPNLPVYLSALGETLAIALLGTLIAAVIAFPLSVLAARNVLPVWIVRFTLRRTFDSIRGVDTLIWALIWIGVSSSA